MDKHVGGAEVPVSLLYADVRGSTALAEAASPTEIKNRLDRFFLHAAKTVDTHDGVIDHIVGDGVMAMWIPGFVGDHHAHQALEAAKALAMALGDDESGAGLPVGCGVHTGIAYVGVVGTEASSRDFTVVGDVANTAARIGSAARAGEVLASEAALEAAGIDATSHEARLLDVRGKAEPVAVRVLVAAP